MRVYKISDLFLFGGSTKENNPYLVAGKHLQWNQTFFTQLDNTLRDFTVPAFCTAELLDHMIAALLRSVMPLPFLVGCTIKMPGITGSSGGVLGNPGLAPKPAQGRLEELGDGWKLITYSGSPGLSFKEGPSGSFCPNLRMDTGLAGKELILELAAQAYDSGVEEFIALTDGSGPQAAGSAIIQRGREYCAWSLDELVEIG